MRTLHALNVLRRIFKMEKQRPSSPESEDANATNTPAAATKNKSKLGVFKSSFRTVGRGKNQEGGGDAAAPKDKKKFKKIKDKGKVKDKPRAEASSEDAEGSVTEGSESPPVKASRTSKATTLVRKLSIGKYKVGVSGSGGKGLPPSKTPTPPPEESPKTSKSDVSSDAGGRQAPEGEDGYHNAAPPPEETPPPQAAADQSETVAAESQSLLAAETAALVTQRATAAEDEDAIPEETPEQEEVLGQQLETLLERQSAQEPEQEPEPTPEEAPPIEVEVKIRVPEQEPKRDADDHEEGPMADLVPEEVPQDIVLAPGPALPSLKSEIQTAEKLVEAERGGDVGGSNNSRNIGDAIAEARSRLSHSLETAASVAQQVPEKREHLYKILVIGELGTGKTSIIKRYVHQFFSQHYRATIGVDFALKVLNWDANTIIRLQLWDIAGQERFGNMTRVYYKEAVGAFVVFDVTRAATFDAVFKWKQDLDSKVTLPDGSPIPCVLLANKCDQQKEGIVNNAAKMDEYCKEKGFSAWFETSAKENINIEEAARSLVKKILQNDKLINQNDLAKDAEKINLDGSAGDGKSGSRCSC